MMELKVLGSSSNGNCYILDNGNEALIIEAGVRFIEVKKALDFNIRKVVGCLISHQHNDHAKYIKTMIDNGFPTLALPEVWEAKEVTGSRAISIELGKAYSFGGFRVKPFSACHDVPCCGFLIDHPVSGRVMFLTDSFMCEYLFPRMNQIMIECNYSDQSLVQAISDGRTMPGQRERLLTSHLELGTCKQFLLDNDLSGVANIVLLHLSDNNSNEGYFVDHISRATGKCVYAAKPGLQIDFNRL